MKEAIILFLILLSFSCRPDGIAPECSLDSINNKNFTGMVGLCNAMGPGIQQDFKAKALVVVSDSLLHFYIQSNDTSVHFVHAMAAIAICVEAEPGLYVHNLKNFHNDEIIGQIGQNKYFMSLQLTVEPCLDNGRFEGVLKN